jgi:hypothetical protein
MQSAVQYYTGVLPRMLRPSVSAQQRPRDISLYLQGTQALTAAGRAGIRYWIIKMRHFFSKIESFFSGINKCKM